MTKILHINKDGPPCDQDGNTPPVYKQRHAFIEKYCAGHGWDIANLSIEQIMEIRRQPEWIEAGKA